METIRQGGEGNDQLCQMLLTLRTGNQIQQLNIHYLRSQEALPWDDSGKKPDWSGFKRERG